MGVAGGEEKQPRGRENKLLVARGEAVKWRAEGKGNQEGRKGSFWWSGGVGERIGRREKATK